VDILREGISTLQHERPPSFRRKKSILSYFNENKALYLLSLPGILYFALFKYIPLFGSVMAFQDYNIFVGIWNSTWVGLDHFYHMFEYPEFTRILNNTIFIGFYSLVLAFPIPIILALLMNELRGTLFKRYIQTAVYVPHFLSWIVIGGIVIELLSPNNGIVNRILESLGKDPIYFMGEESYIRTIIVGSGIWRSAGWGTIIYLAAISGVNPDLYEAAEIDGANRWRKAYYITIPGILPSIVVLFLLQIGTFLDLGFENVFVFLNPLNSVKGDILDTYIYRVGLVQGQYAYTTAIGLFKSFVGLLLIVGTNMLSKKTTGEGLY
jgi:putative aldouronate transport system permease protein